MLLIRRKRLGPRSTPPNHRLTTTITLLTFMKVRSSASFPPAASSPSSSQSMGWGQVSQEECDGVADWSWMDRQETDG